MLLFAVTVAAALVVFNTMTNRTPSRDGVYLARNITVGVVLVAVAWGLGLSTGALGLAGEDVAAGLRVGRLAALVVVVVAAVSGALAQRVPVLDRALDDARADLAPSQLLFHLLLRIPVGTALFEEVVFRGVLFGAFATALGTGWAVALSSLAFGLWHVGPTRLAARENGVEDDGEVRRRVLVAVVVTMVGGVGFAWLRLVSGSVLASTLAHATINGFALLLAALHRSRRPTP